MNISFSPPPFESDRDITPQGLRRMLEGRLRKGVVPSVASKALVVMARIGSTYPDEWEKIRTIVDACIKAASQSETISRDVQDQRQVESLLREISLENYNPDQLKLEIECFKSTDPPNREWNKVRPQKDEEHTENSLRFLLSDEPDALKYFLWMKKEQEKENALRRSGSSPSFSRESSFCCTDGPPYKGKDIVRYEKTLQQRWLRAESPGWLNVGIFVEKGSGMQGLAEKIDELFLRYSMEPSRNFLNGS